MPHEAESPSSDPWIRALALAEANGRALAAALGVELGRMLGVEQHPASTESELVLTASFSVVSPAREGAGPAASAPVDDDVVQYIVEAYRPVYSAFRERVLAIEPSLTPAPAPLRKGKRRYEGFRQGSRNIIYAGFRKRGVNLMFELPPGHGVSPDEYVTRGRRDWREVLLTGPSQLEGAVSLAEDTVRAFSE